MKNKLIVTGGCGFIGSHVVNEALAKGYEVLVLDNLTYASSMANLPSVGLRDDFNFVRLDISNFEILKQTVMEFDPDAIIHLAAETHVDRSISDPSLFISTNILGTFNLLEAFRILLSERKSDAKRFLHVSTDEVYGSLSLTGAEKFNENSRYAPRSPYAASKASSDHLVRAWNTTYKLPVMITNCSNNYGPFQFLEKLIPLTITNAMRGQCIPIYGDGLNVRDWLHVSDHARAILTVLEVGRIGETYNVGAQNERTNIDVVQAALRALANVSKKSFSEYESLVEFVTDRKGHDARYAIDPRKINNELSWKPSISFEQGLEATVAWYYNNQNWWSSLDGSNNNKNEKG